MPAHARRGGFTLVELLLATTIMTMIVTMMGVIFTNTERIVSRTRAIIDVSFRLRTVMDQSEETMANRSGCMPMQAGNLAWTKNQRFNLFSYQANNHLDYGKTPVESGQTITNPNGAELPASVPRCWSCDVDALGNPLVTGAPIDPHAPGKQIKQFAAGDATWVWGIGTMGVVHSTAMIDDTNATYYNGGTPVYASRTFDNFNSAGDNAGSSLGTNGLGGIGRRYTRLSTTASSGGGPYRRSTILPTVHFHNGFKVWADTDIRSAYLMRSIRGPSFFGEIWGSNTVWASTSTGDYGKENAATNWHSFYEPDWTTVMSGGSVATATAANDVPWRYGALIRDESVTWRCEAPSLFVQRTDGTGRAQRRIPIIRSGPTWWTGAAWLGTWRSWAGYFYGDTNDDRSCFPISCATADHLHSHDTDTMDWPEGSMPNSWLDPILAEANISRYSVRNGRIAATWYASAPADALGRFGSLTRRTWHLGRSSGNPDRPNGYSLPKGLIAGFHGSLPTGMSSPGHPPWVDVQVGAVGGFDSRAGGTAVETTASVVLVLR